MADVFCDSIQSRKRGTARLNKDIDYNNQPISIELSFGEWQQVLTALRYRRRLLKRFSLTQNKDSYIQDIRLKTRIAFRKIAICCDEMYNEWYEMFHGARKLLFSLDRERGENYQDAVKTWLDKTADIS